MTSIDSLEKQLAEFNLDLAQAIQAAGQGEYFDLSPLRPRVEQFCNALMQLPPTESKLFLPRLEDILQKIDDAGLAVRQAGALNPPKNY